MHWVVLEEGTAATYLYLKTRLSECSHFGHSKVRLSYPGLSGAMRVIIIVVLHFGQGGRIIEFG
jgi:hypothetical protein